MTYYLQGKSGDSASTRDSFAKTRLRMGVTLYYKLLEKILDGEKSKNKPLDNLIKQAMFHQALFACCLEIVIFSYNSQRTFPWILDTFKLESFYFYKVIEVIIRYGITADLFSKILHKFWECRFILFFKMPK